MTKLRNATLALAASLLATGALGQGSFMQDSEVVTVAEELFGSGDIELDFKPFADNTFTPKAKLIYVGTDIAASTTFDVTFTLMNAKFEESASIYDVMWGTFGPKSDQGGDDCDTTTTEDNGTNSDDPQFCEAATEASVTVKTGGTKGTNSVTYTFTVGGALSGLGVPTLDTSTPPVYAGTTRKIVFVMPDLTATGLTAKSAPDAADGKQVWVRTSVSQATRGGTGGGTIARELNEKTKCGDYEPEGATTTVACPLVDVHKVLTGIAVTPSDGEISLAPADERKVLVDGSGKALDRVKIATVAVTSDFGSEVNDAEGNELEDFTGGALRGNLRVTVSSSGLRAGDVVYVDENTNKKADGSEPFDVGDMTRTDTLPLNGSTYDVYYVPNGKDELMHRTTFTISAMSEFAERSAKNRSATAMKAMLNLHGIMTDTVKAYAIAPLTATDTTNVRVTCEATGDDGCNVFLDCTDTAGMSTFGDDGVEIASGNTVRWDQMAISAALPLESWTGRLSCELLSTDHITVQVLTRSEGVLVNNTYVASTED